jgi:ABC-type multidrug transport system fused ATPase/permease subunit
MVLITPLAIFYIYMQRYYLKTKRELKRLDSISRSPIYAHFQESMGGITTIRAYCQQERFTLENESRVDANLRACSMYGVHQYEEFMNWTLKCRIGRPIRNKSRIKRLIHQLILYI